MVELVTFVQSAYRTSPEWSSVEAVANDLLKTLNSPETLAMLARANQPGASSVEVQATFRVPAESLGFQSERKGLFAGSISGLRPDYFRQVGDTGILLEVERGKTTANNMDLLDFWKCHVCGFAMYLFLLVPTALQHNPHMTPKKEFLIVQRRLSQFFEPRNYTNVRGLCVFGY